MAAMSTRGPGRRRRQFQHVTTSVHEAFGQFLAVPTFIILAFIACAGLVWALDHSSASWLEPARDGLSDHLFSDRSATIDLMLATAGGVFAVMSITFAILLLAVQQSAASMSSQVFDQFLKRPLNQIYFGYIVGLVAYLLIVLALADQQDTPVFGATLALVLTITALYLVLLLVYHTVDQMRPTTVVGAIHDYTLKARARQEPLLAKTRRESTSDAPRAAVVSADTNGYLTGIAVAALARHLRPCSADTEVVLRHPIGTYVSYHDTVAEIRCHSHDEAARLAPLVQSVLRINPRRDLGNDPSFGIFELTTIAWVATSTAQSNPARAVPIIGALRDLLARWTTDTDAGKPEAPPLPVVYPDNLITELLEAFASLYVVASESMQFQTYAGVCRALAIALPRLRARERDKVEDVVLRGMSVLGEIPLTAELETSLEHLAAAMQADGRVRAVAAIRHALLQLRSTIGELNSRGTRTGSG